MADSRWVWLGFCTHSTALSLTNRLRALPSQLWPCCLELHLSGSSASSGPLTQQAGYNWVPTLPRSASTVIWAFVTSFPSAFPDTISFPFLIDWFGSFYICTHCIDPWLLVWFCDPPVWPLDWSYPLEPSRSPASMQRRAMVFLPPDLISGQFTSEVSWEETISVSNSLPQRLRKTPKRAGRLLSYYTAFHNLIKGRLLLIWLFFNIRNLTQRNYGIIQAEVKEMDDGLVG